MKKADIQMTADIIQKLDAFQEIRPMPGIDDPANKDCFVRQIIDSIRRIKYVTLIKNKVHDQIVCNPQSNGFDPLKAASFHLRIGNKDEAAWLVFLATHFGKNLRSQWQLTANVYGRLGQGENWTWINVCADVQGFRDWLDVNADNVKDGANFGNHRKYESINGNRNNGTGEAVATYVTWSTSQGGHAVLFNSALANNNLDPRLAFNDLFNSLHSVIRFGRTAKFDYLTMIGKLGIAHIEPNSTYMTGATGPYSGAKILFGSNESRSTFDEWLNELEVHLGLYFGMQVLEDSICNWQKSPNHYNYFGG